MANDLQTIEQNANAFLKGLESTLPAYAVRNYKAETFIRSAMMAIVASPDLQECLITPEGKMSVVNALRMAAGTGLSLNPQEGKACMVAYSKKVGQNWIKTASYQVMKNGLIELSLESDKVDYITAETIRENDVFKIMKTPQGDSYTFSPDRKDRGEIDGFMAVLKLKDGRTITQYMTRAETEEHRDKYAKNPREKDGELKPGHAWVKSFEGMGQKTILKKLLKSTHISREVDHAVGSDGWEPGIKDVTPVQKGISAGDLNLALEDKTAQAKAAEAAPPAVVSDDQEQSDREPRNAASDAPSNTSDDPAPKEEPVI